MSSSTAFEGRQSRRDAAAAANRDLDLLIRDLADARLDFGEDGVERIEEEITEETITTTTTTTKRRKKKRRAVSSSRVQEQQRKRDRAHEQLLQYAPPPRRTHTPEVIMVEQPLKMEAAKEHAAKIPISREQHSKKKHHKSDSGFTFVTSIEKEFPARYEWRDCLVPTAGGIGSNERSDAADNLHSAAARRKQFERRDSNQSSGSSSSSAVTASTATAASTTNRNRRGDDFATTATTQQQRKTKNGGGSIVAPPSDFNDDRAVAVHHRDGLVGQPATVVRREFDENGGVTKTVTTTTTEEREYKVINYDDDGGGGDLDEAISADMAELDDLRQLAAAASASSKPKKPPSARVVTFNDDLRLALDERNRQHVVRSLNDTHRTRHGSGDSRSHGGTVHVPVNSEVKPPGGGSSRAEDAAYRLRFLWRQPQTKGSPRHVCSACNSAIEGRCVTALFRKFHPEHFVCSYCLAQLSQGTFKERGQKPYCQNCYNRL